MAGFTKTFEEVLHDPEMVELLDAPIDYGFGGRNTPKYALPVLEAEAAALRQVFSLVEAYFTPESGGWHTAQPLVTAVKQEARTLQAVYDAHTDALHSDQVGDRKAKAGLAEAMIWNMVKALPTLAEYQK